MSKQVIGIFLGCIGAVLLVASSTMFIVASEFFLFNMTIFVSSLVFLGLFLFFNRKEIFTLSRSRFLKNIIRELITFSLVLGVIGLINYLSFKNNKEFDLTENKLHSLSEQTMDVLERLKDAPLEFTLFAKKSDWRRFLNLVNMYERASSHISLKVIDSDTEPALVSLNKITHNGTMLIKYKKKEFRTILKDELSLTNTLLKILSEKTTTLYFSTGHSERELSNESQEGLSYLASVLKNSSFNIGIIPVDTQIPDNAGALIISDPKIDFSNKEISIIEEYLRRGGKVFLSLPPRFKDSALANLGQFLEKRGVRVINGMILDRLSASSGSQASVAMVDKYVEKNPITKGFKGKTFFPVTSFFKVIENSIYEWRTVIQSTPFPGTWGETNFSEIESGRADYNEGVDLKGPLPLIILGREQEKKSRVVVAGSSGFVSNQFQTQANNFNFFLNMIGWMSDETSIKSLNRPSLKGNLVYISDIHFSLIFYIVILFFPFTFFGLSIYFYKRKLSR